MSLPSISLLISVHLTSFLAHDLLPSSSDGHRGDRGWLSHGLVVTLPISYSLDGGTPWGFTRDLRIAD